MLIEQTRKKFQIFQHEFLRTGLNAPGSRETNEYGSNGGDANS